MEGSLGGPRMAVTRWPRPIVDEGWRARLRLRGEELKAAWSAFLGRVPWEWFVTLTFDPKVRFAVSRELASREAFRWLNDVARAWRKPIAWAYSTERGKSGRWHAHVLVAGAGRTSFGGAGVIWRERNGHAHVEPVYSGHGAVLYTTKAAALEGEVVLSDTLVKYRDRLGTDATVALYRAESEAKTLIRRR